MAAKGDGIYSILRKNDFDPVKYYKDFFKLNKSNISLDSGLYVGQKYLLPLLQYSVIATIKIPTVGDSIPTNKIEKFHNQPQINYPIFGEKHAKVTIENQKLKGAVYYLISGHGGPDPGALEKYNGHLISEDEYAYDVNLRLARKLISSGATVYIIIEDSNDGIRDERILEIDYDETNYPNKKIPRNHKLRLRQRTETVNALFSKHKKTYQRLIVTHVDSRSKGEKIDVFFYHHKNSKKGKVLAENIQSTFKQKYARYQPNREYSGTVAFRSDLYLINNTLPPMAYIELGNIKNAKDQKRILDYENREAMAKWITEGLILDYKQH